MVPGTLPWYFSSSIREAKTMSRALARKKPQEWMWGSRSSGSAAARASRVGNWAKRAGVTWLTRSSVHWGRDGGKEKFIILLVLQGADAVWVKLFQRLDNGADVLGVFS